MIQFIAVATLFLLALIPAKIASGKGYSFPLFYVLGVLAFLPTLIVSLVIKNKNIPHAFDTRWEEVERKDF